MTVLAASDGNVIFLIIALIVGALGHWNESRKKKQAEEEQPNIPPARPPSQPANTGDTEQERLRRFLENLGVPAPAPQPPQHAQPSPRPIKSAAQVNKRTTQQPRPQKQKTPRVTEPPPFENQSPGRLEESASAIESVSAEFAAIAKGVDVPQAEQPPTPTNTGLTLARQQNALNVSLRAMLSSPQNLRAALLAREILGPPKSLAE